MARANEDRFKKCFDNMLDALAILRAERDDGGRIVDFAYEYVNPAGCLSTGITQKEYRDKKLLDIYPDYEKIGMFEKYCLVVETGEPLDIDALPYNGWLTASNTGASDVRAVKLGDGIAICWRNVTEKKRLEEALARRERQYRTLVENAPMVIFRFDRNFRCIYVSPSSEKSFELIGEQILGKSLQEFGVAGNIFISWRQNFEKAARTRRAVEFESKFLNSQGENRYYIVHIIPEMDEQGHVETFLIVASDITEKKNYEVELQRLDRLNLVGEMAAGIGHEVRNPMTTVRGYLQMLQVKKEFAKYNEHFTMMIEELDRANSIIAEFLSLAKDKAVEMKCGNLNNVILSLVPLLQADAFRQGHEIHTNIGDIPDSEFDEKEIRQLILNLVRNGFEAIKDRGKVSIRTYMQGSSIFLSVQDTGIGIPDDLMKKLGTPFVTTKDNGTGLGLPVCYRIAERHGAKIKVDTGSQGTTFTIVFNPLP